MIDFEGDVEAAEAERDGLRALRARLEAAVARAVLAAEEVRGVAEAVVMVAAPVRKELVDVRAQAAARGELADQREAVERVERRIAAIEERIEAASGPEDLLDEAEQVVINLSRWVGRVRENSTCWCRRSRRRAIPAEPPGAGKINNPALSCAQVRSVRRSTAKSRRDRLREPRATLENTLMSAGPWVAVGDVACHLGVSHDTVYRSIDGKGLHAHKLGRLWKFKLSEVDEWVRAGGAATVAASDPDEGDPR